MNIAMSTRFPTNAKIKPGECTEFQMHKSQQMAFAGLMHLVIDFTEHKLRRHIEKVKDAQQKLTLVALLNDYIIGSVAVAWKRGQPIWIRVSKA
jgi:hypothetical protein